MRAWLCILPLAVSGCTLEFDECLIEGRCGPVVPTSSCEGLEALCGEEQDCCLTASVPGGTFALGTDAFDVGTDVKGWVGGEGVDAEISAVDLDVFEVTVGRFRTFVSGYEAWREGGHPLPGAGDLDGAGAGWQASFPLPATAAELEASLACEGAAMWTDEPGGNESHPINCVDWYVAFAFCIWDGGRLPSEAEWHFAASGGEEQRAYPWSAPADSDAIDFTHAVLVNDNVQPVGNRPAGVGRFGHLGLGGNVREWVLDLRAADYPEPCVDCVNLTPGNDRVRRGGDFASAVSRARAAYRGEWNADDAVEYNGIRCARASEP